MPVTLSNLGIMTVGAAAAYTGPGDVLTGAIFYFGFFAYNAAYATGSNPCCDLVDQAGANPITINILSTGKVDVASISAWVSAHSVTTILVSQMYDHTGSGRHFSQSTNAKRPPLVLSSIATNPAMVTDGTTDWFLSNSGAVFSQPLYWVFVGADSRPALSVTDTTPTAFYDTNTGVRVSLSRQFGTGNSPPDRGDLRLTATTQLTSTITGDNNPHCYQCVANSTSSIVTVDNVDTTGDAGTAGLTSGTWYTQTFNEAATTFWTGSIGAMGLWNTNPSAGTRTSMNSNNHTNWGF